MLLALILGAAEAASLPASEPAVGTITPQQPVQAGAVTASVNPDQAQLTGAIAKPWSLIASTGINLGTGTFLSPRTSYVAQSLNVQPAWLFALPGGFRLRASINQSVNWEYTLPDNNTGRRFNWSDTIAGASARVYKIPTLDIDLWGSFRFVLPISLTSQRATLVTALIPGLGASRTFAWTAAGQHMSLNLRYDFVFRKNFHRFSTPIVTPGGSADAPYAITRQTDVLNDGGLARGSASTDMTFTNGVSVSFSPLDWLAISVFGSITNVLTYPLVEQRDMYTAANASTGPGRSDNVTTNIDVTFTALPQLLVSLGMFTAAPPFAPDNRTLYNPFWASSAAPLNYTMLYTSLTLML